MPGGDAAAREPFRMAIAYLYDFCGKGLFELGLPCFGEITAREQKLFLTMLAKGINSPLTSSCGRLFDAVAALIGVRTRNAYEGQAAIELEALADPAERGAYRFLIGDGAPAVIDPLPAIEALLDDLAAGAGAPTVSARFHNGLVAMTVDVARRAADACGCSDVALSGGVMMDRLLLGGVLAGLERAGLSPLLPRELPVNDGGISFGQAVVALARRDAV